MAPTAGAGANLMPPLRTRRVIRVAPAPTTSVFNCVARTRHGRLVPAADEAVPVRLHYAAGCLAVIQPARFSVWLPGGPITSLAKAALALAPARAAVQAATASNFLII